MPDPAAPQPPSPALLAARTRQPGAGRPGKTVRAKKARRSSTCPACRAPIWVGELIASAQGGGRWKHADCAAAADRAAAVVAARFGRPVTTLKSL